MEAEVGIGRLKRRFCAKNAPFRRFVPATHRETYNAIAKLRTNVVPYLNLPEKKGSHAMNREKMAQVHWVKPHVVAEIGFNERTVHGHLRHSRFLRLRPAKRAK